jgi:hypothetical protein
VVRVKVRVRWAQGRLGWEGLDWVRVRYNGLGQVSIRVFNLWIH